MLHYADPEFNNAFCNLTDITELPDRPTLKIVSLENVFVTLSAVSPSSSASALFSALTLSSPGSSDTEILPRAEETSPLTSHDPWPSTFEVPNFSVNIEYRLRQGNLIYMRDGIRMSVSRDRVRGREFSPAPPRPAPPQRQPSLRIWGRLNKIWNLTTRWHYTTQMHNIDTIFKSRFKAFIGFLLINRC